MNYLFTQTKEILKISPLITITWQFLLTSNIEHKLF